MLTHFVLTLLLTFVWLIFQFNQKKVLTLFDNLVLFSEGDIFEMRICMSEREFRFWFDILDSKPMLGFIEANNTIQKWYEPLVFKDKLYLSVHFDETDGYISIYDMEQEVLGGEDAQRYLNGENYDFDKKEFLCSPE